MSSNATVKIKDGEKVISELVQRTGESQLEFMKRVRQAAIAALKR